MIRPRVNASVKGSSHNGQVDKERLLTGLGALLQEAEPQCPGAQRGVSFRQHLLVHSLDYQQYSFTSIANFIEEVKEVVHPL